jgi:hypothetical protein
MEFQGGFSTIRSYGDRGINRRPWGFFKMAPAKLVIRKGMFLIQGKVRPCCSVQLVVSPQVRAVLDEHFLSEVLFKRAAYSSFWPEGAIRIPGALAPHVSTLLKNDACPEITVKTLLGGQLHQGTNVWETMSFEFIAKLAFENFLALDQLISEMGTDVIYNGTMAHQAADLELFKADTAAEVLELTQADLAA